MNPAYLLKVATCAFGLFCSNQAPQECPSNFAMAAQIQENVAMKMTQNIRESVLGNELNGSFSFDSQDVVASSKKPDNCSYLCGIDGNGDKFFDYKAQLRFIARSFDNEMYSDDPQKILCVNDTMLHGTREFIDGLIAQMLYSSFKDDVPSTCCLIELQGIIDSIVRGMDRVLGRFEDVPLDVAENIQLKLNLLASKKSIGEMDEFQPKVLEIRKRLSSLGEIVSLLELIICKYGECLCKNASNL